MRVRNILRAKKAFIAKRSLLEAWLPNIRLYAKRGSYGYIKAVPSPFKIVVDKDKAYCIRTDVERDDSPMLCFYKHSGENVWFAPDELREQNSKKESWEYGASGGLIQPTSLHDITLNENGKAMVRVLERSWKSLQIKPSYNRLVRQVKSSDRFTTIEQGHAKGRKSAPKQHNPLPLSPHDQKVKALSIGYQFASGLNSK